MDTSALIDSLHPLEIKVLLTLGTRPPGTALESERLAEAAELEPSQLSMAIEWLLAKSLIAVQTETVTPVVSLTKVGEEYYQTTSPIERVLAAARDATGTGKRLTIPDLQSQDGLDPSDVSKAVGRLKKEGVLLIIQGGCIETTGRPSPTTDALRTLLGQLHGSSRELDSFTGTHRQVIEDYAVKRGNAKEPFRVDERVARSFVLSQDGGKAAAQLLAQGVANVASPLFGGIPATGAIARTATNVKNGGRTPVAGMVHALTLLLIVLFPVLWLVLFSLRTEMESFRMPPRLLVMPTLQNYVDIWESKFFRAFENSAVTAVTTTVVSLLLGVPAGVISAVRQDTALDYALNATLMLSHVAIRRVGPRHRAAGPGNPGHRAGRHHPALGRQRGDRRAERHHQEQRLPGRLERSGQGRVERASAVSIADGGDPARPARLAHHQRPRRERRRARPSSCPFPGGRRGVRRGRRRRAGPAGRG